MPAKIVLALVAWMVISLGWIAGIISLSSAILLAPVLMVLALFLPSLLESLKSGPVKGGVDGTKYSPFDLEVKRVAQDHPEAYRAAGIF